MTEKPYDYRQRCPYCNHPDETTCYQEFVTDRFNELQEYLHRIERMIRAIEQRTDTWQEYNK
jgi:hypothetical protein